MDNSVIFFMTLLVIILQIYTIFDKNIKIKKMEKGGKEITAKMLTGLIPKNWKETVTEFPTHYACRVKGKRLSEEEWDNLFNIIKDEFSTSLLEVYSTTSNGVDFTVYLKKNN